MNPAYIELVNYVQTLPHTEKRQIHQLYCELIPKSSRYYFPYIKANKKEQNEDLLNYISSFYECSLEEAEDYIIILGKEGIEDILNKLGLEDKQIKKLCK